jgi:ankyrin repeat protein
MAAAIETMMAGDIAGLRHLLDIDPELINRRAPVAYRDDREATLLHFLLDYPEGNHPPNVVEIAKLLIDSGADVESLDGDSEGSTAFQLLMGLETPVPHGIELTELLLDSGSTTTNGNVDQHGMDAFTVALMNGHTECAALIYERGYPPGVSWVGAGLGNMNLMRSFFGEGDDTTLPAEQRADCLGEDAQPTMNCAFLVASINGQTEVVEYLLDKGMDVDLQPPGSDFAGIGATALHWAAHFGHRMTAETLVARGANILARDDVFQLTPAGWAAWFGHDEIKRFLLAKEKEAIQ